MKALRVLIVEDSEYDVLLIINELKKGGIEAEWKCIETAEEMHTMLDQQHWDVILSSYYLSQFTGLEALKIVKERELDIPFILLASTFGEDVVVDAMRAGAKDYILKDRMKRLVPAVIREVRESELRRDRKNGGKAEQESAKLYRALFEKNQAVMLLVDNKIKNLPIVDANEAAVRFYGYSREELTQKTIMDLNILPAKEVRKKMAQVKKEIHPPFESQHRLACGEVRDVKIYAGSIDAYDRPLCYMVVQDITEQKNTERALRECEQRYRGLTEHSPNAVVVHSEGKFVYANNEAAHILGTESAEKLVGKSIADFIHPEYHKVVTERIRKVYTKQASAPLMEQKVIRPDGKILDLEVAAAMVDYEGKPASQVVFRDITAAKRAQLVQTLLYRISNAVFTTQDLNELFRVIQQELRSFFGTDNFYIAFYEKQQDVISLPVFKNECNNFKAFPAGKTLAAYVIKQNRPLLLRRNQIDKLVKAGKVEIYGANSKVWLGVPLKAKNEVVGIIAVQSYSDEFAYSEEELEILKFASDQVGLSIERKQAEEKIKTSLDEKVVLLKEIHHRVKNNLQVISSLLYLQSKFLKEPEALAIFRESQNRVKSMALVHETLYQSKNFAKINFQMYIRNLVSYLIRSYRVDYRRLKLNMNVEDVSLDIDSAIPCGLIVNELVSNALKYAFPTKRKGNIHIDFCSDNNGKYYLIIKGDGVGLKKNFLSKYSHTLGLQLVHTLVDQLQGTMEIDNNKGTTFKISFNKPSAISKRHLT